MVTLEIGPKPKSKKGKTMSFSGLAFHSGASERTLLYSRGPKKLVPLE
jgi:hypothetical protein